MSLNRVWVRRIGVILALGIISVLFWLPLVMKQGLLYGDDLVFHLHRITALSNVWESPVNFSNAGRYGFMVNIFYPWLLCYPAYLLTSIFGSYLIGYSLFILGVIFLSAVSGYWMFYRINKKSMSAILFSLLYTFSTYHAVDVFLRAAVGEILAFIFIPIVFLGLWYVLNDDYEHWPTLAFGMVGLLYSHLLTTGMVATACVVFFLVYFFQMDNRNLRILALFKSVGLFLIMGLGFLVPLIEQTRFQKMSTVLAHELNGAPLSALLGNLLDNSWVSHTMGPVVLVAAIIIVAVYRRISVYDRMYVWIAALLFLAETSLVNLSNYSDSVLGQIQFLFRFNILISFFVLYVACVYGLSKFRASSLFGAGIVLTLLSVSMNSAACTNMIKLATPNEQHTYQHSAYYDEKMSTILWPDYRPLGANFLPYDTKQLAVRIDGHPVKSQTMSHRSFVSVNVHNNLKKRAWLRVGVYRYFGERVTVNGKITNEVKSQKGLTLVKIPKGKVKVEVEYKYSWKTRLAMVLSCIGLTSTLFLIVKSDKNLWNKKKREFL